MSMTASSTPQGAGTSSAAGIYLGLVQLLFVSTWTVYTALLPQLAAQVGLAAGAVAWILLADQLVFLVTDLAAGMLADRTARTTRQLAPLIAGITAVSCGAFLLLPFVSHLGADMQPLFFALLLIWAVTSSALRAPLFALVGKLVPKPQVPWQASLLLFGFGIAAAAAPYLNSLLRDLDPRVPFVIASLGLLLASLGIGRAERRLADHPPAAVEPAATSSGTPLPLSLLFLLGMLVVAVGFQVHTALSSPRLYGQFIEPAALVILLPLFWFGFNLVGVPIGLLGKRFGDLPVAAAGAMGGAVALYFASQTTSLTLLVLAQIAAGAAWGCVLLNASTTAIALGGKGREGLLLGGLFSVLALAAAGRTALMASGMAAEPSLAPLLAALPAAGWLLGGLVLGLVAVGWWRRRGEVGDAGTGS